MVHEAGETARTFIGVMKEQPLATLAVALVIGLVLGALWKK